MPSLAELDQPGDYFLKLVEDQIHALWTVLPDGEFGRCPAKGHGNGGEPEWEIALEDDGTVTVSPSIDNSKDGERPGKFHGHLTGGVWS